MQVVETYRASQAVPAAVTATPVLPGIALPPVAVATVTPLATPLPTANPVPAATPAAAVPNVTAAAGPAVLPGAVNGQYSQPLPSSLQTPPP